jgi:2-polyprenyl-6-methoxyphenol hydroxylase-like FAD-dependent oxidoreductase
VVCAVRRTSKTNLFRDTAQLPDILAHREINGSLHAYVVLNKPEDWIHRIDFSDPATALAHVAEEFDGWAPELTALITDGETAPVPRTIHELPGEHRWDRVHGVTVIGDAAHLMSPFAGEGANRAMYDGAALGEAIAANPGDIEAALLAYEKDLFPRSASAAAEAGRNLKLCFGDNAPQILLDLFTSYRPVRQLPCKERKKTRWKEHSTSAKG